MKEDSLTRKSRNKSRAKSPKRKHRRRNTSNASSSSSSSSSDNDSKSSSRRKRKGSVSSTHQRSSSSQPTSSTTVIARDSKKRRSSKTKKRKKKRSSSSSSSTSTSSSSSPSSSSLERKKKKKKSKKKKKHKKKKSRNKTIRDVDVQGQTMGAAGENKIVAAAAITEVSSGPKSGPQPRIMKPMTKEEWEKQQSVIRRVYDEETGRERLIRGDGEILEEIVSRERHGDINKASTRGDGNYYAKKMGLL